MKHGKYYSPKWFELRLDKLNSVHYINSGNFKRLMGRTERRDREKKEMRDKILNAALKLFVEKGFENVSIRKIAKRIEYSPGTIYLYFKDKDEIFFELHNLCFGEFFKVQQEVQNISDPIERLQAHGKAYINFAMQNPKYYDLMFISRRPAKKIKKFGDWALGDRTYDLLKQNIMQCMKVGAFQGIDIEIAAFSLWSYVHGIASLYVRDRLKLLPEEQLDFLMHGALELLKKIIK